MLRFRKPMLAKQFVDQKVTLFPCYTQPKLDGVRCITDGRRFWSRNGKLFPQQNFKHLRMSKAFPSLLDGELMVHNETAFEDVVSIVKRAGHQQSSSMYFHAFDVMTDAEYIIRRAQLRDLFERAHIRVVSERWVRLIAKRVASMDELREMYETYLDRGYEGLMIRSVSGLYVPRRSADLLKWKPLKDREFLIVDVKEAKGKDKGTPIFICETEQGALFRARPMGTLEQRRRMFGDRRTLIGTFLTVEFQNFTKYGVPRFPRAKVLRDYE
jgi:DNA ligase-1